MAGIVLARKIDCLYCIVIVLLEFQLLIIVLGLYWSLKGCIGQPWLTSTRTKPGWNVKFQIELGKTI